MARVTSSSSSPNVNLSDGAGNPLSSTGGSLNVNVTSQDAPGTPISLYNEVSGVAMGADQVVLTYTVPPGSTFTVTNTLYSGDSVSTIVLNFNGTANAKGRLYFCSFNGRFDYGTFALPAGTVITVVATNNSQQGSGTFNATLQGILS